jgi:predicted outer membrane protein
MRRFSTGWSSRRTCSGVRGGESMLLACRYVLPVVLCALVLVACGRKEAPPAPTPPRPSPVQVRPLSASAYVAIASSMSLFVIRASRIVSVIEGDTGLGQYARQFEEEQAGIGSQLSFAGRRLNLLPSTTLQPAHANMLRALAAAPDRDKSALFLRQMRQILSQGVEVHQTYSSRGDSPTLRPVASMAAPIFAKQLEAMGRF